jgi:hypothetical protein
MDTGSGKIVNWHKIKEAIKGKKEKTDDKFHQFWDDRSSTDWLSESGEDGVNLSVALNDTEDKLHEYISKFKPDEIQRTTGWIGPSGKFFGLPYADKDTHGLTSQNAVDKDVDTMLREGFIRYRSGWHNGPDSNIQFHQPLTSRQMGSLESLHGDPDEGRVYWHDANHEIEGDSFMSLRRHHGQKYGIKLNETVNLSAPPKLRDGDRWVTLKPHGPDSEDYVRVIIREHDDGTAHVVWAGHKGLLNLKLHGTDKEGKPKAKPKALNPDEIAQLQELKKQKEKAHDDEREAFGQAVAKHLSQGNPDSKLNPKEIADALNKKQVSSGTPIEKDPQVEREKRAERNRNIVEGVAPEVAPGGPSQAMPLSNALDALSTSHIDGEAPPSLQNVSPELMEAWERAKQDPELMKRIAGMHAQHKNNMRDIAKSGMEGQPVHLQIGERIARYADESEGVEALMKGARERATYASHSKFWEQCSDPAVGAGYHEQFLTGAVDALNMASQTFGGVSSIDPGAMALVGPELCAAAVANRIESAGIDRRKAAMEGIERLIGERSLPTVEEAMQIAEDADRQRESIRKGASADVMSDATKVIGLKNQAVKKQQALGRAAGSLETAASIADYLRKGTSDGVVINAGAHVDEVESRLKRLGMGEGDYQLGRDEAGSFTVTMSSRGLNKLGRQLETYSRTDREIQAIKSHQGLDPDFSTPHLRPDRKYKDSQQATIKMALKAKLLFANVGVGVGKTQIAGGLVDELKELGNKSAWYIVPTNLIGGTLSELQSTFPGLRVEAAHPDYNESVVTGGDRAALYRAEERHRISYYIE